MLLLTASAAAQDKASAEAGGDEQTATLRVRSSLVVVPVEVRDSSGRPVRNLKLEDFRVFQNGQAQKLVSLDEFGTPASTPQSTSPASVSDSKPASSAPASQLQHIIIVIDQVNTEVVDQQRGQQEFAKAIAGFNRPGVAISLVVLDRSGAHLVWGPKLGVSGLPEALHALPLKPPLTYETGKDLLRAKDPVALAIATSYGIRSLDVGYQQLAIRTTLAAFRRLASVYGGAKGRKTVLWATAGFPFSFVSGKKIEGANISLREYENTMAMVNEAQLAIYPVDIRGLNYVGLPTAEWASTEMNTFHPEVHVEIVTTAQRESISNLEQVAALTGGRAYTNRNDIGLVLEEAAGDAEHYYLLSYKPDHSLKPGYQELAVKTVHHYAHVRASNGFYVAEP